jgi:S-adenosylmethionine synthetase
MVSHEVFPADRPFGHGRLDTGVKARVLGRFTPGKLWTMSDYLFTSESVTEGHPDKVCDRIADSILDDILAHNPAARVACEVAAHTGLVLVFGEISTDHYCRVADIARETVLRIGYTREGADVTGFAAESCSVLISLNEQSPDIAAGVNASVEARSGSGDALDQRGAGDQGLMFGYATRESEPAFPGTYMPLPILLAHRLAQRLAEVRRSGGASGLRPDGKTQVSLRYRDGKPHAVETVLISTQHMPGLDQAQLKRELLEQVVAPVIPATLCPGGAGMLEFLCNPAGPFIHGGPEADSGLTGRKLIVDTYGGAARHGGGSFSGKDPTKVDRSANYYARYAAKNLVAAGAAERLELQVSYAIGRARPVSLAVETFGTGTVDDARLEAMLWDSGVFDFRPQAIIDNLGLTDQARVRYADVSCYGHFGRTDLDLPWEKLDKVEAVQGELGLSS